jgi:hypothetical protein
MEPTERSCMDVRQHGSPAPGRGVSKVVGMGLGLSSGLVGLSSDNGIRILFPPGSSISIGVAIHYISGWNPQP